MWITIIVNLIRNLAYESDNEQLCTFHTEYEMTESTCFIFTYYDLTLPVGKLTVSVLARYAMIIKLITSNFNRLLE